MLKVRTVTTGLFAAVYTLALTAGIAAPVSAEEGVTDTEVLLGGTHPYSGPASAYGAVGKGALAYFSYVNDHGGVNGRKITYKDLDDSYSPPQAVQDVRQLVEQDKVFAIFCTLGTAVNMAIRPYLNQQQIPQLFVATGASTWAHDYKQYPYTIGWQPDYQSEAIIYSQYILKEKPNAKIAVIYQNDDFGLDYVTGLKTGLGSHAGQIVKMATYEVSDPDVSSQIANLKASGADTILIAATPKFAIQSLVAIAQQSWKPLVILSNVSASSSVMRAANKAGGPAATTGVVTTLYGKDPADPKWANDTGMKLYKEAMAKYNPGADATNGIYAIGFAYAFTMVDTLKQAGKNLTRAKVMDVVNHLNETDNPLLLPGIAVKTTPSNHFTMTQEQLQTYGENGEWHPFGGLIDARPYIKEEKG
jgi:branched-chain amino acid transport system substrate-binding protein